MNLESEKRLAEINFRHEYAIMAIKYGVLLNGAAALSTMTLLGALNKSSNSDVSTIADSIKSLTKTADDLAETPNASAININALTDSTIALSGSIDRLIESMNYDLFYSVIIFAIGTLFAAFSACSANLAQSSYIKEYSSLKGKIKIATYGLICISYAMFICALCWSMDSIGVKL